MPYPTPASGYPCRLQLQKLRVVGCSGRWLPGQRHRPQASSNRNDAWDRDGGLAPQQKGWSGEDVPVMVGIGGECWHQALDQDVKEKVSRSSHIWRCEVWPGPVFVGVQAAATGLRL